MFVILLKCCAHIAWCVEQPHLRPAAFSVQPEITTAVCSRRVCSQGDFASRRRGLSVNTQRRSGRLPLVIRQAFHRALQYVFFFFLRGFLSRTFKVCQSLGVWYKFSCSQSAELGGSDLLSPVPPYLALTDSNELEIQTLSLDLEWIETQTTQIVYRYCFLKCPDLSSVLVMLQNPWSWVFDHGWPSTSGCTCTFLLSPLLLS